MQQDFFKKLENLLVRCGFVWGPEPEIYNPLAGFFSYGPLGKLLKNNIEEAIRFEFKSNNFYEIEAPNIYPKEVWEASGHLKNFADKIVFCKSCKMQFKAEKVQKNKEGTFICPDCNSEIEDKIEILNLMVKTEIAGREAYCRPETATTSYLQIIRYLDFFRKELPIRIFQIGKAFRNEIAPRQGLVRAREFVQAESQMFIREEDKDKFEDYERIKDVRAKFLPSAFAKNGLEEEEMSFEEIYISKYAKSKAYIWCLWLAYNIFLSLGIPKENMRFRQHSDEERAFYCKEAWDLEINTKSFGWLECCGIHDRGDYDLKMHAKFSGKNLAVNINGKEEYLHVLEIAFGVDRTVFSILDMGLDFEKERMVLRIPRDIAPIKVAVFPLINKEEMVILAKKIYENLKDSGWDVIYDDSGSIGRRYRRVDERGVPLAITIDGESIENQTVTLRDRDTMKQKRIKIKDLEEAISNFIYKGDELNEL